MDGAAGLRLQSADQNGRHHPGGGAPFAALIFFTIPIYHWVARALDGDWARGDIRVGPAPAVARTKGEDVSTAVDADMAAATTAESSAKEGDE